MDPEILGQELRLLSRKRHRADLTIDGRCTLVSPLEKQMDGFLESLRGGGAIGTTMMGIGPAYAARALRMSPRALDLVGRSFNLDPMLRFYGKVLRKRPDLGQWLRRSRRLLRNFVGDVSSQVESINDRGGGVLFEGAHGTLLDLQFGTYPFVTSSSVLAGSAAAGLGLPATSGGSVLGVTKAYTTRVGSGPFPTELSGALGSRMRELGAEYGATTGRPRRTGWLDLVALRYAVKRNGASEMALSKVDVLSRLKAAKVCVAYSDDGSESSDFYRFLGNLERVRPVYQNLPGLSGAQFGRRVPRAAQDLIELVEEETGAVVRVLSYGEERSSTVLL